MGCLSDLVWEMYAPGELGFCEYLTFDLASFEYPIITMCNKCLANYSNIDWNTLERVTNACLAHTGVFSSLHYTCTQGRGEVCRWREVDVGYWVVLHMEGSLCYVLSGLHTQQVFVGF